MGESKVLESLFPGPGRILLRIFFAEPHRWWSLPQLAAKAKMEPPGLRRLIVPLLDGGLIRQKQDDGKPSFQPDPACPVYEELRSMVTRLLMDPKESREGKTILVVEDQVATAQITRILLESWGYRVLEAHNADEGIRIFENNSAEIQLLLTDVIMPGMSGPQLAEELWQRDAELRVILMSGYPSDSLTNRRAAFLAKPFNPARLSRVVRKELDRAGRSRHA